ncbi:hypothetical protein CDAR_170751 [Caerostris darwini]|uniref:Uncharacterized protein n=1 Tax=Caerostris darwini TaxID=1538125 RepID=A0AAV4SKD1_9ARAC|nr:hypothetical protein CDAR_170751 [Caerostris darwini]
MIHQRALSGKLHLTKAEKVIYTFDILYGAIHIGIYSHKILANSMSSLFIVRFDKSEMTGSWYVHHFKPFGRSALGTTNITAVSYDVSFVVLFTNGIF